MEKRNPTQHRMTRRAAAHDYTATGIYHITLHVADGLGRPFGAVVGSLAAPDGSAEAPHTALTPVGQMVEHELLHTIHEHYPMITIQDYVVMPDHLHFIVAVQDKLISQSGKTMALGQVLAGFKKGCNRRYWEITGCGGQTAAHSAGGTNCSGETAAHTNGETAAHSAGGPPVRSVDSGFPAGYKVPSSGTSGRQPLFAGGFCDVMPVDAAQLATQRAYIAGNPRSRLLRSTHRAWLSVRRGGIATALTPSALLGYLRRECGAALTPAAWEELAEQLLMAPSGAITCDSFGSHRLLAGSAASPSVANSNPASPATGNSAPASPSVANSNPASPATGNSAPASQSVANSNPASPAGTAAASLPRLLPVVCHRKDAARFAEQKARCLEEAARGAVLVSARIARGEQEIMDESVHHGFPVIIIEDTGFGDRYHPSAARLTLCEAERLLLLTPWQFRYRAVGDSIHVPRCKAMNCVAQALCRLKDSWWKTP